MYDVAARFFYEQSFFTACVVFYARNLSYIFCLDSIFIKALAEQATPLPSAENPVTEILDDLSVPADQRPDFADCGIFTADHPSDDRNRLYLLVNSAGTRLYVVEFFL